jgi:hypothetical protein
MSNFARGSLLVLSGSLLAVSIASAHKLSPTATAEERRITGVQGSWISTLERSATGWGLKAFGEPVHEEETDRIYGCDGSICDGRDAIKVPAAVLAGVRWNDDPPFRISSGEGRDTRCKVTQTIRFQTQPYCWYQLFSDAQERSANNEVFDSESGAALLYRTHFGDLQFLHAMASADGVKPAETQRMILDWAQFNWRIMVGEYGLGTKLSGIDNDTIRSRFGRSGWNVQDLYTLGSPGLRSQIRDVAFGSLLHMLEDSFAAGHVDRGSPLDTRFCSIAGVQAEAPGLINEFHAYNHQDHALHAEADSRGALQEHLQDSPDVVDIGRQLVRAYKTNRSWEEVKPFFECVFAVADDARASSSGSQFAKAE